MPSWTPQEIRRMIALRMRRVHPREIADMLGTGRTVGAINERLSRAKRERDLLYPPLPHGRRKYFKAQVDEWRKRIASGCTQRQIAKELGVSECMVSMKMTEELHGEMP